MKAVLTHGFGGPAVLSYVTDVPLPVPQSGELLLKVIATAVNRPDIAQREGVYPPPPGASPLLGLEVAAEVVGGDCSQSAFKKGDLVCALVPGGGYAEYCTAPFSHCLPIPAGWTPYEAASLPEALFTVWSNVFDFGRLSEGETLLVHGGASSIGTTAIQLAHALGHTVYTTVGSDERAKAVRDLGATVAINYKTERFEKVVLAHTQQTGVNVILDMVAGGDYLARDIRCLAPDGRIAIIAILGGATAQEVPVGYVLRHRMQIFGSTLRPRSIAYKAQIAQQLLTKVWPLLETGAFRPLIHKRYPLHAVQEAHIEFERAQHIGKIILQLDD